MALHALPIALRRWGLHKTLALGVVAKPAVIGSLSLHGIGYTFFFVGSQIFMDRVSAKDIRASAQSLLTLGTLGVGNPACSR